MAAPFAMTLRKKAGRQRESGPMGIHPGPAAYRIKRGVGQVPTAWVLAVQNLIKFLDRYLIKS